MYKYVGGSNDVHNVADLATPLGPILKELPVPKMPPAQDNQCCDPEEDHEDDPDAIVERLMLWRLEVIQQAASSMMSDDDLPLFSAWYLAFTKIIKGVCLF